MYPGADPASSQAGKLLANTQSNKVEARISGIHAWQHRALAAVLPVAEASHVLDSLGLELAVSCSKRPQTCDATWLAKLQALSMLARLRPQLFAAQAASMVAMFVELVEDKSLGQCVAEQDPKAGKSWGHFGSGALFKVAALKVPADFPYLQTIEPSLQIQSDCTVASWRPL